MEPLISIVIPVYNVEDYVEQCIKSIINQKYRNIEIILVNDGSTDSSGSICDKYKLLDERIIVIHKVNGGLSDARNVGLECAKGKYISFIDSDDYIEYDYIDYLYNLIHEYNVDISSCTYQYVDKDNNELYTKKNTENVILSYENKMLDFFRVKNFGTTAWGKLYKTEIFIKNDIRYPLNKYHEDVYTTYKLVDKANGIVIGNKAKYFYRKAEGSITQSSFNVKHLDAIEANEIRSKFIEEYYPECKRYAYSGIIYSCNQVLLKMFVSDYKDYKIYREIQEKYRRYEKYYIMSKASFYGKLFSLFCFVNVSAIGRIVRRYKKNDT